jgi:choline dehydrogenase-like flavoprotein
LRFFGGSTNHWGGICLPLDEDDFEHRTWVEHSGWPLTLEKLNPYYRRAHPILELGKYDYAPDTWETTEFPQLPYKSERMLTRMVQNSPPTRFGQTYRPDITKAPNISSYLHANVVNIEADEDANEIQRLHVTCLPEKNFTVTAKKYVLAMGGIENPRLLLLSDKIQKTGLGNQHDLVGRYFADHPYLSNLGFIVLRDANQSTQLYQRNAREKISASAYLTLSAKARKQEKLLNSRIHIKTAKWSDYSPGNKALDSLYDGKDKGGLKSFSKKLYRVLKDLDDVIVSKYDQSKDAYLLKFGAWTELVPNPDSRVFLGEERDALGQRRVTLDWRISEQEKNSLIRTLKIIATELGRTGLGRMKIDFNENSGWPWEDISPGLHHMGTTRMHTDANQGVVDQNCKVHGIANLYITGSSVFPTFGHANPTLTITALALRLTDHIKEQLK